MVKRKRVIPKQLNKKRRTELSWDLHPGTTSQEACLVQDGFEDGAPSSNETIGVPHASHVDDFNVEVGLDPSQSLPHTSGVWSSSVTTREPNQLDGPCCYKRVEMLVKESSLYDHDKELDIGRPISKVVPEQSRGKSAHPDKSLIKFFHIFLEIPLWETTPDHFIVLDKMLIKGQGTKYEDEPDGDKNYLYASIFNPEDVVLCIAGKGRFKFVADDRFPPIQQLANNLKSSPFTLQIEEYKNIDSDIFDDSNQSYEMFNLSLYMVYKPQDPTWGRPNLKVKNIFDLLLLRTRDVADRNGLSLKPNIEALYRAVKEKHSMSLEESDLPKQSEFLRPCLRPYQLLALRWMINREMKEEATELELEPFNDWPMSNWNCPKSSGGTGRKCRWYGTHIQVVTQDGTSIYYNPCDGSLEADSPKQPVMPTGGILAEEMGLGKTVEVLALILGNPRPNLRGENAEPTFSTNDGVTAPTSSVALKAIVEVKVQEKHEACAKMPRRVINDILPLQSSVGPCLVTCGILDEQLSSTNNEKSEQSSTDRIKILAEGEKDDLKGARKKTPSSVSTKQKPKKKTIRTQHKNTFASMSETEAVICGPGGTGTDIKPEVIEAMTRRSQTKTKRDKTPSLMRQAAVRFYNSQLKSVNRKPKKLTEVNKHPSVVCLCGTPANEQMVQCSTCQTFQHAKCVGIKDIPTQSPYFCPQCWQKKDLLVSGATLVISPTSICDQWVTEVEKYVSDPNFKLLVYKGVTKRNFVQPTDLAKCNFVITTYEVLRSELRYADINQLDRNRLRNKKRFVASPSPLVCLDWWRVCLDEAQMAQSPVSMVNKMAQKLESVNRWAVTGTPLHKSIDDLFGTLQFLRVETYSNRRCWEELVYRPYLQHNSKPLHRLISMLMWRTGKQDVLDQIQIPTQSEETHWVHFTPVEEHYYRREQDTCSDRFLMHARNIVSSIPNTTRTIIKPIYLKSLQRKTLGKIMNPLLYLRQACTHMQARRGKAPVNGNVLLTMEEVLEQMIKKTRTESEEALRQNIASINGLAALNIIKEDWPAAVELYRTILLLSEQYKDQLNVDKPQLVHTLHNLAEVLDAKHPSVATTPHDDNLRNEVAELEIKYMDRYEKQLSASVQQLTELGPSVEVFTDFWWSDLLIWLAARGDEAELLRRLDEGYEEPYTQAQHNMLSSIISMNWELMDWSEQVTIAYKSSKRSLAELEKAALGPDIVEEANQCHLRRVPVKCRCCRICLAEDKLLKYEGVLFSIKSTTPRHTLVDDVVVFGQLAQGTWQGSDQEICLKVVHSLGRGKKAEDQWLASGRKHFKALDAMKKEFRRLRLVWTHLRDKVAARDELRMCRIRLRLLLPNEAYDRSNTDNRHVLPIAMLPWHFNQLKGEQSVTESTLRRKTGTLQYLKHLRKSPDLYGDPEPCPICRGELNIKWSVLHCGHVVCLDCLMNLGRQMVVCPLCRERTPFIAVSYVHAASQHQEKLLAAKGSHSAKVTAIMHCLLQLRVEEPEVKILVFSTWELVLDILGKALTENKVTFVQLPGNNFQQNVRKFKEDPTITALLLPLRSGSKGLNLTEASHIIFVEPILNPNDELQAVGRIHRIGQTKKTVVHRFLVHDTIEERIYRAVSSNTDIWDDDCVTVNQLIQLFTGTTTTEIDSELED